MKGQFKGIGALLVSLAIIIGAIIIWPKGNENASIISTSFIGYDFARAVTGEKNDVAMLVKPGAEMHTYEPTPQDIIRIKNAKLFIYIGGESEEWVEDLLVDNNIPDEKCIRLMDYANLKQEDIKEGMESDEEEGDEGEVEYDEHIWTSIENSIHLVEAIRDRLIQIDGENQEKYSLNTGNYTKRLRTIDSDLRTTISSIDFDKRVLIFGDRFPFRYFVDEYGLSYYAAFPGCSEQTEASANTVSFLIKKAKELNARAIFKTEMTDGKLADTIAKEVGAKVYTLNAAHNISAADFNRGVTYADLMAQNAKTLKEVFRDANNH